MSAPLLQSSHYFSDNILCGSVPTCYYRGDGIARSLNNRVVDGTPVVLGAVDEAYSYNITTTGAGSPVVHSIQFPMPTGGVHLMSVWSMSLGGDSNNSVFATYLLQNWHGSNFNANGISQIGSTIVSSGAPLVGNATLTAGYSSTTKMVTLTLTQSGGGGAGGPAHTTISLRKFQ